MPSILPSSSLHRFWWSLGISTGEKKDSISRSQRLAGASPQKSLQDQGLEDNWPFPNLSHTPSQISGGNIHKYHLACRTAVNRGSVVRRMIKHPSPGSNSMWNVLKFKRGRGDHIWFGPMLNPDRKANSTEHLEWRKILEQKLLLRFWRVLQVKVDHIGLVHQWPDSIKGYICRKVIWFVAFLSREITMQAGW